MAGRGVVFRSCWWRISAALLIGLLVSAVTPTATAAPGPAVKVGSDDLGSRQTPADVAMRAALQAVVDAGASGAMELVDDGAHVSSLAVGAARLDPRRALRVRDQVRVGSITKTVVATITLQLVGEGRLRLADTVQRWLPGEVPNGSAITIRMLLNHTSGIFDYVNDPAWLAAALADPHRDWAPQELVAVAVAHPPLFAPGQGWSYSNTGYVLLGLILERLTGEPLEKLVAQRVTGPLHLHRTFLATSADFVRPYAHGYLPPSETGDGYLDTSSWAPSFAWASGALVSTAADLARFYQALLSGRLLRPALMRAMTTTVTDAAHPGFGYGLGIYTQRTACGTVWGHDGGIPGYTSFALNNRAGTRSAVVLVPTDADPAIAARIEAAVTIAVCRMFDRSPPLAPSSAAVSGLALRR